jgi:hypothetical protein
MASTTLTHASPPRRVRYAWTKPDVIVQHESLKFGDEVGDESIGDWERVASKAEQWRQYGEWVEYRDSITGTVFYVNTEGRHGGECVTSVSVSRVVS